MTETLVGIAAARPDRRTSRVVVALCAAVAALASVASGAGVFLRGDLATETFVSPRGERVALASGVLALRVYSSIDGAAQRAGSTWMTTSMCA